MGSNSAFTGVGVGLLAAGMPRTLHVAAAVHPAHAAGAAAAITPPRKRRAAAAATASSVDRGTT